MLELTIIPNLEFLVMVADSLKSIDQFFLMFLLIETITENQLHKDACEIIEKVFCGTTQSTPSLKLWIP